MDTSDKNSSNSGLSSPFRGTGGIVGQIPNLFTLLNLVFGCIAIVFILQTGETIVVLENTGATQVVMPERMTWGAIFLFAAAVVDFLDGFLARMLKASSEMGKQLDSLSDVVSFGVAPGMILYQLLRLSYAQGENGLDTSMLLFVPAFLFSGAVAWRLAKFNIATNQSTSFIGVPSPAAGLFVASFPLIIWFDKFGIQQLFINQWFLYAVILVLAYLMTCNRRFMALKFSDFSFQNNLLKYILLAVSLVALVILKWLAVPVIFVLYLVISFFSKEEKAIHQSVNKV
ncbi:CDP-diacylglycerol---serine O-phosphatidyltransferase [Cnuella takakiae]|uniref:CDP-diacylglycerol---serine O-phosphatidyltransferase n=1 Tax=Cnuella takakiae TaxID=1302690 RepID=A0A1M5FNF7_9BACT|nr:CDP-alcohol phosphatidyltransferase family protein [Cnuella takakiae]SHF92964.1 CDP-diacylglycerol---serine O-phosphatidyltransferase [Cnuella takakiae]